MPFCYNCGSEIAPNAAFCPNCGVRYAARESYGVSKRQQIITKVLQNLRSNPIIGIGALITILAIFLPLVSGAGFSASLIDVIRVASQPIPEVTGFEEQVRQAQQLQFQALAIAGLALILLLAGGILSLITPVRGGLVALLGAVVLTGGSFATGAEVSAFFQSASIGYYATWVGPLVLLFSKALQRRTKAYYQPPPQPMEMQRMPLQPPPTQAPPQRQVGYPLYQQPGPAPSPPPPQPSPLISRPVEVQEAGFCTNCGSRLLQGARFCDRCGQRVE